METKHENGTILLHAIESSDFTAAIQLLRKAHSFSQDELDKALISACQLGHKFLVQTLVRSGANVHCKDTCGNTTLMFCAQNGFTDIVRFLIEKKVDVNAANSAGNTALLLSVSPSGSTEITELLLEQPRIQFCHQNKDGYTALMKAVEARDFDTVMMLIDQWNMCSGISSKLDAHCVKKNLITAVNHKGETAYTIANKCGVANVFESLAPRNIQRKPKKSTIQPPLKTTLQKKLNKALKENDARSFTTLLDCELVYKNDEISFDVMLKSMLRCKRGFRLVDRDAEITIIKRLLENGADVNTCWNDSCKGFRVFEIDESCEVKDLSHLVDKSCLWIGTPLKIAARLGDCELVSILLKHQARVNDCVFQHSSLHCALHHGHNKCAKLLIQHGAEIHIMYALVAAVKYHIPSYMDFLCENYQDEVARILQKSNNLNVFAVFAARGGDVRILTKIFAVGVDCSGVNIPLTESRDGNIARILIENGADVNATTEDSRGNLTPLLFSIIYREYDCSTIELIEVLLENGADVNATTEDSRGNLTPLLFSLIYREYDRSTIELIRMLLENGASTNVVDCNNETPLMIAASKVNNISLLKLLLDHGADVSSADIVGNTALIKAIMADCSKCATLLIMVAKDKKDVLNAQNNKGLTALMAAAVNDRADLMTGLLSHGADVNIKDGNEDTALIHYLFQTSVPDEKLLISLIFESSDVNCQNKNGHSPLMVATMCGLQEAVSVLLDSGADVNAVSKKDETKTALSFLPVDSFVGIFCMECLLDKGANASYLNPICFSELIFNGGDILIPKLLKGGLGPSDFQLDILGELRPNIPEIDNLPTVSPLCLALLTGNLPLAQYFVGNVFLTKSDVSSLMSNNSLRDFLDRNEQRDCVDFLASFTSQPLSLFNLAQVAVSSAVGTSPGRDSRVNILPIPGKMKDKLLFKSEDVPLVLPYDPTTETHSLVRLRGVQLSMLEDYYLRTQRYDNSISNSDEDSESSSRIYSNSDDDLDYILEDESGLYWY